MTSFGLESEVFDARNINGAREQLDKFGHLAVSDIYATELATPAVSQTWRVMPGRLHEGSAFGEQKAGLDLFRIRGQGELNLIYQGIVDFVDSLGGGYTLKPQTAEHPKIDVIWQSSDTVGGWHMDKEELAGIVAITNLKEDSHLEIRGDKGQGDVAYLIRPGIVAFLDHRRRLRHRGVAGPKERVGLVLARERTFASKISKLAQLDGSR